MNNIEFEGNLMKEMCAELKIIADRKYLGREYLIICACALELAERFLGKEYDFAIDIEKIAQGMKIQVVYQPLNSGIEREDERIHHVVGRNLKRINRITNQPINNILIDTESTRSEQRYALAHEIAHYMIHFQDEIYNDKYCIMPLLFKEMEEMVADIFAIFLLIPVPLFLKEFMRYIGGQSVPVKTSEWLKYLSIVAEIPYEYVAIGYQNIRYVCGMIYDIKRGGKESYFEDQNSIAISSSMMKVLDKWKEQLVNCLNDEIVNKIFS